MLENCYCGRTGEIEEREPVVAQDGGQALRCPDCGHLKRLEWLLEGDRRRVFEGSKRRRTQAA